MQGKPSDDEDRVHDGGRLGCRSRLYRRALNGFQRSHTEKFFAWMRDIEASKEYFQTEHKGAVTLRRGAVSRPTMKTENQ